MFKTKLKIFHFNLQAFLLGTANQIGLLSWREYRKCCNVGSMHKVVISISKW